MELNFLTIADSAEDLQPLHQLLGSFQSQAQVNVSLQRIGWDRAWQTLLMAAVEGKGPQLSQIGSTWTPTLAMLEALRAFSRDEANSMGGDRHFLPQAWETVSSGDLREINAIPWTIYTFVLFYRRDLLLRAGLDPDQVFLTPQAMREGFTRLKKDGITPWAFPSLHPYADLVHIASSWARANGGDFISADRPKPVFARPEACRGLMDFFELFPFMPPSARGLSVEACTQAFARGETAVLVGGVEVADELLGSPQAAQEMRANLGVTTLPGVPWIGGDHLVIWKNVLPNAENEKAALELVRFLSRKETQVEFFKIQNVLPARSDAYDEISFSLDTTLPAVRRVLETGRPHPHVRLWRRIEAFLDEMLLDIGSRVLQTSATPAADTAKEMLSQYEQKLAAVLKG
ncbi:MAG TPA: extracellular solute-binding protein [Anaerolineales bacterium]|nr:extracellular solute-binding protein [Anaerolineales bacterium]